MESPHSIGVIADTEFGAVRGSLDGSTNVWRGIRYAAPPVGELRFRAPQPPSRSAAIIEATEFGPRSPQPRSSVLLSRSAAARLDEDCLTLNVWSPSGGAARKPVLFWIHGGDNLQGAAHEHPFSGRSLAERGDVVVVSVNYRLGILGFVDFSSFATREQPADSNLGLRDVIAALEWVQGNIAQFGGDPNRVTIGGESSGGDIVTTLLAVPTAAGLFHRAIAQSPSADSVHTAEHAANVASTVLAMLRVHPASLQRLRETPPGALIAAAGRLVAATRLSEATRSSDETRHFGGARFSAATSAPTAARTPFAPVVDGTLVCEHPLTALQNGRAHRVPLLLGSNRDAATGIAAVISTSYEGHASAHTMAHDRAARMPPLAIADAHSPFAPVWLYRFDYSPPVRKAFGSRAPRSSELPYLWGSLPRGPLPLLEALATDSAARRLSARVQHRWLSFAKLGIPTHAVGEPVWNSYDEHRATMIFDARDVLVNDLDAALRADGDSEGNTARLPAGATHR
ncbi:carboxylesterase/lipase family protein [Leifsonia kafniensis]|uniref:Carboxylic ester hydrolase n=1 Tax=Leifsonia kafniensis TaxID=475957 RepID=A0ABP7KW23_9MICO